MMLHITGTISMTMTLKSSVNDRDIEVEISI